MTDRDLDRALARLKRDVPAASEGAEQHALASASAAFDAHEAEKRAALKGSAELGRQTSASPSGLWRIVMQNRFAIGGAAACLVAVPLAAVMVAENSQYATPRFQQAAPPPPPAQNAEPELKAEAESRGPPPNETRPADSGGGPGAVGDALEQRSASGVAPSSQRLEKRLSEAPPAPAPQSRPALRTYAPNAPADSVAAPAESRDRFEAKPQNGLKITAQEPVSTFSIDADTASYAWVRRALKEGRAPAPNEVRVEELVNYFPYADPAPEAAATPFRPTVSVFPTPWSADTKLVRIAIKGFEPAPAARLSANLVFLIDTSGSMDAPDKLPLVKASLKLLLTTLAPDDHVAIVTYAGEAGVALQPTKASDRAAITDAIDRLGAGGSTAGAAGIAEAYRLARKNFDRDGVNRVMLATDGDFNVGVSDPDALTRVIEAERKSGVFLSVLGFGRGNYNDALMQRLAQNGNGTAAYIDELDEAQKTLVEEAGSTLFPIAKDVKIQVEFNPATVSEYRLIGYESRLLNREDFKDDRVDAGEVGSGASVTALYEITPTGSKARMTDELRYGRQRLDRPDVTDLDRGGAEFGTLKIRYKPPKEDRSAEIAQPIKVDQALAALSEASDDARFSAAVAAFGQKLRGERFTQGMSWDEIAALADGARGADRWGYRAGFVRLVQLAKAVSKE